MFYSIINNMGEMKVEHVLLFLVGAFLVYHMMGKCGRVEGIKVKQNCSNCTNPFHKCLMPGPNGIPGVCKGAPNAKTCNDRGGTWCPDHVDTIPGQTGPPETQPGFIPGQTGPASTYDPKAWCMEHTQRKLDAGLIDINTFWNYYRACQSEY